MKRIGLYCIAFSVLVSVMIARAPSGAEAQEQRGAIIDRVVAVVEDRSVLQSEIDLEVRRFMLQSQRTVLPEDEEKKIRREVLDGLISDHLLAIHADKEGITVTDDEVDATIERLIEDNMRALGGEDAFKRQLEKEGMTLKELRALYRERVKSKMLIERLMYSKVMGDVIVTEAEVSEYFRDHIDELPKRPQTVRLATILLMPKPSEAARAEPLRKIREAETKVRAGEDFAGLAKEYSEGPSAQYGGSLGYIELADFADHPTFVDAVRGLTVGEVSEPVLTGFGYHLIKLEDVSGDKILIRHILMKVESGEDDVEDTAALADSIRAQLVAGADFAEMAERYSDAEKTKESGGFVGEVAIGDLPENVRDMLAGVGDGEIAPVVRDKDGFRIFKVLGRMPERTYTFEEAREELKKIIEQEKLQERFMEYIEGLKAIYYVEIKEGL